MPGIDGRIELCRRFEITKGYKNDSRSIFVKNEEAFQSRIDVLDVMYNTYMITDIFEEEASHFESEKKYIEYLNTKRIALTHDIEGRIMLATVAIKEASCGYLFETDVISDIDKRNMVGKTLLRVGFDSPLYEGYKYLVDGLFDVPSNIHDYVLKITGSEYLASAKDLELDTLNLSKQAEIKIRQSMANVSLTLLDLLTPKAINKKELLDIGNSEAIYESSPNRSIKSIDTMYDMIVSDDCTEFENCKIELFNLKSLETDNNLMIKESVLNKNMDLQDKLEFTNQVYLVTYLRMLRDEKPSKYDKYFNFNGNEAKLTSNIELDLV
jgi:hypothetical protein